MSGATEKDTPQVGQKMDDGTFYLGRFNDKNGVARDWFAAAEDAHDKNGNRLLLNFNEAVKYAKKLQAHGHNDWVIPPGNEDQKGQPDVLNEVFNNKAKIGSFDETGKAFVSWYWSSTPYITEDFVNIQRFNDGAQLTDDKKDKLALRCVRSEPV